MAHKPPAQQFEIIEQSKRGSLLTIRGKKLPPPAKRIVLDAQGFKVTSAKVIHVGKGGVTELTVTRINYLPTIQQVRVHTRETVFPGEYRLELEIRE